MRSVLSCLPAAVLSLLLLAPALRAGENWPEFRGPRGDGHSDSTGLPVQWAEGQGVVFKTPIPGQGWSSPVIWGKQVWMTTATDLSDGSGGKSLRAVCVDKDSGKVVHDVELFTRRELDPKNDFNSYASPTPALEAGRAYISFGNYGNACVDTNSGKVVWKNEDLKLQHKEGPGSSPILYKDYFLLHCDGMDVQYLAALDKKTGKLAWKADRTTDFGNKPPDLKKAYCIPTIISIDGQDQIISEAAFRLFSYTPQGKEIWSCEIPGFSNVPRPVYGHGLIFVCTGYMQPELWAINPQGAKGDVTDSPKHVAWKFTQGVPAKPSILLVGEELYMVDDAGIARCLDAKTGREVWKQRLEGNYTASPLYADGRIYFFSEDGLTTAIEPGKQFRPVAESQLDGRFMTSPAVSGKALFLRTDTHLYRIEN